MATYVYGDKVKAGSYGFYFRSWFAYTTSTTSTKYSVTLTAGVDIEPEGDDVGWNDLTVKIAGTGQTSKSTTANYRHPSKTDSEGRQTYISSFTWSWNRGESAASKTVTCKLSGNISTSTATHTFTVPALPAKPTLTASTSGGTAPNGNYYLNTNYSTYSADITASAGSGSLSSIVLKIGSQTATISQSGTASIVLNTTGTFTPTITATNSNNRSTTISMSSITVANHTKPECTYSITSSGPYYSGFTPYSVYITDPIAYDGASISTIQLSLAGITSTRTTSGNLSITPTSTGTYAPGLWVVDTWGSGTLADSTLYGLSAITVSEGSQPTISYTSPSTTTFYTGNSYTVNIQDISCDSGKTISSIVLKVGSTTTSRTTTGSLSINLTSSMDGTTPTLTVTDNQGLYTTYTLSQITVKTEVYPAIGTRTVTSSAPYYINSSTYGVYSVSIDNITCDSNKTISSIVLTVGSQTASRTTAGVLSINLNTAYTSGVTPSLKITDSGGLSQTYSLNQITVNGNDAPTLSYSITSTSPYYTNYSTYSVTISNLSAKNGKTIPSNGVVLKIGTRTVSRGTAGSLSLYLTTSGSFTPIITITDNIGKTTTYSLSSITINANDPPVFDDPVVTSTGPYYAGYSPYSVQISGVAAQNGKTIPSNGVVLTVGSQTVSGNGDGILSIDPLTGANTLTPSVSVTDSLGKTTTKTLPDINVSVNNPPSCQYTINTEGPYYQGVSSYTITISEATALAGKTIPTNGITLTVGSQSVQRSDDGALTISPLNTQGTFIPELKIKDSLGIETTYSLPQISVTSYVRCTNVDLYRILASTGEAAESGTQLCIVATIDYLKVSGNRLLQPIVKMTTTNTVVSNINWYTNWDKTTGSFTGTVNWSGYTPDSPITLYGRVTTTFDQNTSYAMSITPATTHLPNGGVTSNFRVAQAFFLLVGKAGGHALGIGMKPTADDTLDVNLSANFYDDVVALNDITASGDITASNNIYSNGNFYKNGIPLISSVTITLNTADWVDYSQTVSVLNVTNINNVIITPAPASVENYVDAGILCTAQGTNSLTFQCSVVPETTIDVNVLIIQ